MFEANEMKVLRKIVVKTKIDRVISHQVREYCGIQLIMNGCKEEEENGINI